MGLQYLQWNRPWYLPETPNAGGFPLEGAKAEMCESVMAAMKDFRDDIVARLARVRKYCYVTKEEGGLKSAVRVIKRLGEVSPTSTDYTGTGPADHSCGA